MIPFFSVPVLAARCFAISFDNICFFNSAFIHGAGLFFCSHHNSKWRMSMRFKKTIFQELQDSFISLISNRFGHAAVWRSEIDPFLSKFLKFLVCINLGFLLGIPIK